MAETPIKSKRQLLYPDNPTKSPSSPSLIPPTPGAKTPRRSTRQLASPDPTLFPRRSSRRLSLNSNEFVTPAKPIKQLDQFLNNSSHETPKSSRISRKSSTHLGKHVIHASISPTTPELSERKKRKRGHESGAEKTRAGKARNVPKKKVYYKKVEFDGIKFGVGDDVYIKRRDNASSDDEDPEVEECRVCFRAGESVMMECDECLGGFHLKCLKPPPKEVPEGDWICKFCEAKKFGKKVELPVPPKGKKLVRTLREKLLSSDLWAARIESMWKEVDGTFWFRGHWYMIPEETAAGRQPHNLRRELYLTNDFADIEMESIIRHCYVMSPKEFAKACNEGDDVFLCEYEYDIHWHSFKRLADIDDKEENDNEDRSDEDWKGGEESESDVEDDADFEEENMKKGSSGASSHHLAANSRIGRILGLQKIGTKTIPLHVRCHEQTELERAKKTLLLATLPKSLPCRDKEMEEISAFVKGAISDDQCLGQCLYINGVPGTGKTMSVLSVMRNLRSEVDAGSIKPYYFIEINGLKLASPENIYRAIYEALSGHRVSWKKALQLLNERFSEGKQLGNGENKPCVLLIDELDLLVTRNQSVLYNILDWPTKPNSKLVVIGIANTMDLPEKLLPRISSRMGIQRICFRPYDCQQLKEIILSRLKGIDAFDDQAVEFAARKVAAVSGDARRALEICRRAAEIADYQIKNQASLNNTDSVGKPQVSVVEIKAAIDEMFQAPHVQVMKRSSKLSKIFLAAMVHELYKTGMGETTFEKLAITVTNFCASNGESFPGWDTLLRVGCKLGDCKIILCEPGYRHRLQKLQLNFPSDDVAFALKDCKEVPWLAKYL
ncbi:Origin of replication complex subunit 1B [Ancistrocladus abbreviatus]